MVLVMTVEPGFGGQEFMGDMMPKFEALRSAVDAAGADIWLQADGGVARDTIATVVRGRRGHARGRFGRVWRAGSQRRGGRAARTGGAGAA